MSVSNHYPLARNVGKCFSTSKRPPVPGKEDSINYNSSIQQPQLHNVQIHNNDIHQQTQNQMESSFIMPRRSNNNAISDKNVTRDDVSLRSEDLNFLSTTNNNNKHALLKEPLAPLGFEPEGSDSLDQNFQESSNSSGGLVHLKWTENYHHLMQDIDGVKLFKEFLKSDNLSDKLIDFHFACMGFKIKVSTDPENCSNLAKSIYKKFIKGDSMSLKSSVKKQIVEALKTKNIDETIFDGAQAEIESILKTKHYPAFLTSDIFLKFAETELENSKISSNSDSLERHGPLSTYRLETLMEDQELKNVDQSFSISSMSFVSNEDYKNLKVEQHNNSYSTNKNTSLRNYRSHLVNDLNSDNLPPHPSLYYHNNNNNNANVNNNSSATTMSAIESEVNSFTSDPMTDDAISFTSSSVDGREHRTLGSYKKHMQMLNRKCTNSNNNNQQSGGLHSVVVPRTQKLPLVNNLSETNPALFAQELIGRLTKLKEEQELGTSSSSSSLPLMFASRHQHKIDNNNNNNNNNGSNSNNNNNNNNHNNNNNNKSLLSILSSVNSVDHEYEARKVLEQQCSNIGCVCSSANSDFPAYDINNSRNHGSGYYPKNQPYQHQLKQQLLKYANNANDNNRDVTSDDNDVCCYGDSDGGNWEMSAYSLAVAKQQQHLQQQQQNNNARLHHHHHHHSHHRHHKSFQQDQQSQQQQQQYHHQQQQQQHYHQQQQQASISAELLKEQLSSFIQQQQQNNNNNNNKKLTYNNSSNLYSPYPTTLTTTMATMTTTQLSSTSQQPPSSSSSSSLLPHQNYPDMHGYPVKVNNKMGVKRMADYDAILTSTNLNTSSSVPVGPAILSDVTNERVMMWMEGNEKMAVSKVKSSTTDTSSNRKSSHASRSDSNHTTTNNNNNNSRKQHKHRSTTNKHNNNNNNNIDVTSSNNNNNNINDMDPAKSEKFNNNNNNNSTTINDNNSNNKKTMTTAMTSSSSAPSSGMCTVVGYYFCDESIPYRTTLPGRTITLGQFKQLITKKGNYRYFFKTACSDFDDGVVHEEVIDDNEIVPMWENKILCKVEGVNN